MFNFPGIALHKRKRIDILVQSIRLSSVGKCEIQFRQVNCFAPNSAICSYNKRFFTLKARSDYNNLESNKLDKNKVHKFPRLYVTQKLRHEQIVSLGTDESHYLSNVMRLKAGFFVRIFNDFGEEYICQIKSVNNRASIVEVEVLELIRSLVNSPKSRIACSLFIAPIKKARLKILMEKVTELGVDVIYPVITQRTIQPVEDTNSIYWRKILIESSEQSERLTIPEIHPIQPLKLLISSIKSMNNSKLASKHIEALFVCVERSHSSETQPLLKALFDFRNKNAVDDNSEINNLGILIGPEGGFTEEEIDMMAECSDIKFVSLGENILRAETAAISALSITNSFSLMV
eukprot:gene12899-17283_t